MRTQQLSWRQQYKRDAPHAPQSWTAFASVRVELVPLLVMGANEWCSKISARARQDGDHSVLIDGKRRGRTSLMTARENAPFVEEPVPPCRQDGEVTRRSYIHTQDICMGLWTNERACHFLNHGPWTGGSPASDAGPAKRMHLDAFDCSQVTIPPGTNEWRACFRVRGLRLSAWGAGTAALHADLASVCDAEALSDASCCCRGSVARPVSGKA
jgi:hypothetical protein